jgi:hypothetical protein
MLTDCVASRQCWRVATAAPESELSQKETKGSELAFAALELVSPGILYRSELC